MGSQTCTLYFFNLFKCSSSVGRAWTRGAMVLGKLPEPGRPTYLDQRRARAYCVCSGCGGGGGVVWTFSVSSIIALFFLPLSRGRPDID